MSEGGEVGRVTVAAFGVTNVGRVRKNNEDAFLVSRLASSSDDPTPASVVEFDAWERGVLLAVSDGMGGAEAGEIASALVIESLRDAMRDATGDWDEATKRAVQSASREVFSASDMPGWKGMGATLTAVCVHRDHAYVAEVGDSRAYLLRSGRIRQMTRDQSFVQLLVDRGALKPEDAENYPMKNVVLQSMGQKDDVQVALGRLALRRGDHLLLCSDGLSNKMSAEEMRQTVERCEGQEEASAALIALANERGGEDNITVVLARVEGPGVTPPGEADTLTQTFEVLAEFRAIAEASAGEEERVEPAPPPTVEPDPIEPAHEPAPEPAPVALASVRSTPRRPLLAVVAIVALGAVIAYLLFIGR